MPNDRPLLRATGRVPWTAAYDRALAITMRERDWRPSLVARRSRRLLNVWGTLELLAARRSGAAEGAAP